MVVLVARGLATVEYDDGEYYPGGWEGSQETEVDIIAAFGCTDWDDYLGALRSPTRRAQLQALAQSWKE